MESLKPFTVWWSWDHWALPLALGACPMWHGGSEMWEFGVAIGPLNISFVPGLLTTQETPNE